MRIFFLKMNSSDRIELSIDPGTWDLLWMKNMVYLDPIEFHSEEEPFQDRIVLILIKGRQDSLRLFKQA